MTNPIPTSTSHLSCLCGAVHEPGTLLEADHFPIQAPELCHCNPCRHTTGSLGASFPVLNAPPSQRSIDACTRYGSTTTHDRYFCRTCGTPTFIEVKLKGYWCCLAGIVERDPAQVGEGEKWARDVVEVGRHDFVSDTVDGGLAMRLLRLGGRDVPCYKEGTGQRQDERQVKVGEVKAMAEGSEGVEVARQGKLMVARCHCSGVDLRVKRANFEEDRQGLREAFTEAGDRYIAQFCACRSCRLQSGVSLQPWTYIPPQNVTVAATGKPVVFGRPAMEEGANQGTTLKHYWSSKDVCRSFCGRCGASFFYWSDSRPEVADLALGIVRAESGCMAREWVSWRWRVSWKEEGVDGETIDAILGD